MGTDGAKGLLTLKRAGAATIAQDEQSCVVYGMPREPRRLDAVGTVASLADIPGILARTIKPNANARTKAT
jgi:two-component system chemotaxis response regulator CheB